MKNIALAAFLTLVPVSALAADLPVKAPVYRSAPAFSWTGLYVGGTAGGILVHDDHITGLGGFVGGKNSLSGFLGGPTLGYNAQYGALVLGIEGDYSWSDVKDKVSFGCANPDCFEKIPYFATIRARLGYATGNYLAYVTGGGAFSRFELTQQGFLNSSKSITGWTVGAGLEGLLANGWSWKAEYLFADFGHPVGSSIIGNNRHDLSEHVFRLGINYHFGGPLGAHN